MINFGRLVQFIQYSLNCDLSIVCFVAPNWSNFQISFNGYLLTEFSGQEIQLLFNYHALNAHFNQCPHFQACLEWWLNFYICSHLLSPVYICLLYLPSDRTSSLRVPPSICHY